MAEALPSGSTGEMTAEVSLPPEQLCALGLSEVTPDALAYCLQHGLRHYLLLAIDLIHQCLSSVDACHLRLEQDPETGEEWLVLDVTLQEDMEEVLANCDAYTDRWVSQVPWPERDKIQLVYNVLWAMEPHDFHQLASQLATSPHAAELRTAISRAYYATYHVGVTLAGGAASRRPATVYSE